jgi:invasion protein IalB
MTVCDAPTRGLKSTDCKRKDVPLHPWFVAFAAALALISQLATTANGHAQNNQQTSEVIKDWTLKCATPQGAPAEQCILVQDRLNPENQQPIMQVAVGFWGPERHRGLVITLPLGVTLPQGIQLEVDDTVISKAPYVTCTPNGCQAHMPLDDALLQSMKSGQQGKVVFANARGQAVPVAFSLSGFTAGFAKVK